MAVWNSDGSVADTNAKIASASTGDTVQLPNGTFAWAASVTVNKVITLAGGGIGSTIINASVDEAIKITGGGRVTGLTFNGRNSGANGWTATTVSGWRFDHCAYNSGSSAAKSIIADCAGLIDHVDFTDGGGSDEQIWTTALGGTGATAAQDAVWATDNTFGTTNAIVVEDCTFNGPAGGAGYVSDFGYASRATVRFCTINANRKIDAHGPESNWRSNRQIEAYNNTWTVADYADSFDIRGGSLIAFDNVTTAASGPIKNAFKIHAYAAETNQYGESYAPQLAHDWWTPSDYPTPDHIGIGKDPGKVGGADPAYVFHNTNNGGEWPIIWGSGVGDGSGTTNAAGYAIGATNITLTAQTTFNLWPGNKVKFAGDPNYYTVAVYKGTGAGTLTIQSPGLLQAIPASATAVSFGPLTKYRWQTGNPSATFIQEDIIKQDRDIFLAVASFTGASGVGRGTKAQMLAITPTKVGVGFWVTDEGSWNTTLPANTSGRLYTWSGSAWVLKYEPLTYPHPLISGGGGGGTSVVRVGFRLHTV